MCHRPACLTISLHTTRGPSHHFWVTWFHFSPITVVKSCLLHCLQSCDVRLTFCETFLYWILDLFLFAAFSHFFGSLFSSGLFFFLFFLPEFVVTFCSLNYTLRPYTLFVCWHTVIYCHNKGSKQLQCIMESVLHVFRS